MENREKRQTVRLPLDFFLKDDVVGLAKNLLGHSLFTAIDGVITGGIISETEAYRGAEDRACHAYNNRRTKRTEVMFHRGGVCYVYLCYGIHHLLNIVTNIEGIPHAILIRALEPTHGIEKMMERRKKKILDDTLTKGPGTVSLALGINLRHNGIPLTSDTIWIEKKEVITKEIEGLPRIGVDFAGDDALLPWRFKFR